jgi:hypothetical protein
MVEATATSALIVIETDLLPQVLEVTFDSLADCRHADERDLSSRGQRGERWLGKFGHQG